MTISSRTPEGSRDRCPVCAKVVRVEPACNFGDAPCPSCGTLLWFVHAGSATLFHPANSAKPVQDRLAMAMSRQFNVPAHEVREMVQWARMDSIDMVELLMELEDT